MIQYIISQFIANCKSIVNENQNSYMGNGFQGDFKGGKGKGKFGKDKGYAPMYMDPNLPAQFSMKGYLFQCFPPTELSESNSKTKDRNQTIMII